VCSGWQRFTLIEPEVTEVCSELVHGGLVTLRVSLKWHRWLVGSSGVSDMVEKSVKWLRCTLFGYEVTKMGSRCVPEVCPRWLRGG
jgi:hypothetical protein